MKVNRLLTNLFILIFSLFLFSSCADKKTEQKTESVKETVSAESSYQCPMDCENGKTYDESGSCPVCKMDLKAMNSAKAHTCKKHKDGKCDCKGEKCACKNCAEHAQAMTCKKHKDGKCTCEGKKCACENCVEHS
ncbi:hypothetical protein LCM02_05305 [Lutimonas saemankumensis]|uniref:heavy metal-binding domain-containing protein n=1 Tax=Lutimonas saemankumensis TaxID=483016 RepID=UPI001CD51D4F|nr:heavy metal-binding domain-containing protein [Lutimonas saemankumensis]MCA0931858.1 hypothetical protein [Lutimonas saemankumensis]